MKWEADDGWGLGSVTGLQQAMGRKCGEAAAKEERAPVSNAQSRTLVPVSSRVCCVVRAVVVVVVRGCLRRCCCCAVRRAGSGCSLARWCCTRQPDRQTAAASSARFLSSYIHILCTRGCSILVDQTSNTRGHLRPPPSWWCVRPCAFVSSRLLLTTSSQCASSLPNPIILGVRAQQNGVPVRPSRPIPYPKRYPSSIHFMI